MTGRRLLLLFLAIASVGLIACGDDDNTTDTAPPEEAPTTSEPDKSGGNASSPVVGSSDFDPKQIYDDVQQGVVTVIAVFGASDDPLTSGGGSAGQGSGFVINEDGEIATNAHVVTQGGKINGGGSFTEADEIFVDFADRNRVPAELVGFDPFADVALLRVDPDGLDLQPVELGSASDVSVGEPVAAIGSPFGEDQSLSIGVVSATGRSIPSLTDFAIDGGIQTDASINPGNSGGPLMSPAGKVVGINQQIDTDNGANQGVGFALPIDLAKRSIDQLREDGEPSYAFIGVSTQALYPQLAERLDLESDSGALIAEVVKGGPAEDAGLKGASGSPVRFQAQQVDVGGDVIVAVDGEELVSETDLSRLISLKRPGDTVELEVLRDGDTRKISVKLGARPTE